MSNFPQWAVQLLLIAAVVFMGEPRVSPEMNVSTEMRVDEILAKAVTPETIRFVVQGQGIWGIQIQVLTSQQRLVYDSGFVTGTTHEWNLLSNQGKQLINGVYLYTVTVIGSRHEIIRSSLQRFVVLR
ncbi:hypothetical protein HY230_09865 [Candidatus Acetothermia bacterium]|nr:hypothetical protein [Candidatus Acetothermia bacterium]MBI3660756.1 hypothetical protein [Candidatus Acetothermia bacterium]